MQIFVDAHTGAITLNWLFDLDKIENTLVGDITLGWIFNKTPTGDTITANWDGPETVGDIKAQIQNNEGICFQRLLFADTALDDEMGLNDFLELVFDIADAAWDTMHTARDTEVEMKMKAKASEEA